MRVFILTRKRLAALAAALAIIAGAGFAGVHRSETAVAANAGGRSIPIYYVKTEKKQVALSFDAAWGNEQTQTLLDILDRYKVKTTFFLVGDWVRNYPDDVKKISEAGHDVGNHSNTHPYLTQLGGDAVTNEIETCNSEIEKLTGKRPTLFRPPYGDYNNSVVATVNGLDMYCVQWSIDSLDWQDPSPADILAKVQNNLSPGSIILMHNGAKNTPEALPSVIEYIQSQGYEIVPISQLLPKGSYTTDANGAMIMKDGQTTASKADSRTDTSAVRTAAEVENRTSSASSRRSTSDVVQSKTSSEAPDSASRKSTSSYTGVKGELYDMTSSRMKK